MQSLNQSLLAMKNNDKKIAMLTGYDYPTALALEAAGVDVILAGDSVGTNVLGYKSPQEVTMADMIHHTKAVKRGVKKAIVLTDMPYKSFETPEQALENARLLCEAGADMLKIEGGREILEIVEALAAAGISVMGHIGFMPQTAVPGKIVYGTEANEAFELYEDALLLEKAGVVSVLLECVPERISEKITKSLTVPTIGIGAGRYCDGQVLVINDVNGLNTGNMRITYHADNFAERLTNIARNYVEKVTTQSFPGEENIFRIKKDELQAFNAMVENRFI